MKAPTRPLIVITGAALLLVSEVAWTRAQESPLGTQQSKPLKLDLSIDVMHVLTPQQLRLALGTDHAHAIGEDPSTQQMEHIEVRAAREQHARTLESRIPFGFASIAWAFEHPSQFWRLFVPVVFS